MAWPKAVRGRQRRDFFKEDQSTVEMLTNEPALAAAHSQARFPSPAWLWRRFSSTRERCAI